MKHHYFTFMTEQEAQLSFENYNANPVRFSAEKPTQRVYKTTDGRTLIYYELAVYEWSVE